MNQKLDVARAPLFAGPQAFDQDVLPFAVSL
jgi:hypothetical protein